MIKPRRIGHATFETPDLEKAIAYYTQTMGLVLAAREKERAFLASKIGLLTIALQEASAERCSKLSFEVAAGEDFAALSRALAADGVGSELRNNSIPGIGQVLSFVDCKGTTIELFKDWSYLGKHEQVSGVGPLKLGHVAFVVQDVNATVAFYEKVLGFRVSDWIGDFFVFMRCNPDHHTVNFIKGQTVKLHHMAFELEDFVHIQNSCDLFGQRKIPDHLGSAAPGPRAQHRHLPSQSRRSGHRALHRARPAQGRGARLFRPAPLAPRSAAATQSLGAGQDQHLGHAAGGGFPPRSVVRLRRCCVAATHRAYPATAAPPVLPS